MSLRRCSTPTCNEDKVERIPRNHSDNVSDLLGLLGADLGGDVLERLGRRRPVVVDLLHRSVLARKVGFGFDKQIRSA